MGIGFAEGGAVAGAVAPVLRGATGSTVRSPEEAKRRSAITPTRATAPIRPPMVAFDGARSM